MEIKNNKRLSKKLNLKELFKKVQILGARGVATEAYLSSTLKETRRGQQRRWDFFNSSNKGQTMTEFLFILVLLVFLVMVHIQFCLSYVSASIMHYTSFMAARAEAVQPGQGATYVEDMVGTTTISKLSPIARLIKSEAASSQAGNTYNLQYEVVRSLPKTEGLTQLNAQSPFSSQPSDSEIRAQTPGVIDNE